MTRCKTLVAILALLPATVLAANPQPQGTQVATMVVRVATLAEIMASGEQGILGRLLASGIAHEELSDGSIATGIVYCCGGKISRETMLTFYVPADFRVAVGDVAEISLGRPPAKKQRDGGDSGSINRALRVRESFNDQSGLCRWDPENDTLWMRVLYCDWMQSEGWLYRGGRNKGWYKPVSPE